MSDIVSAMGSRARAYNDCIARSYIVGIPKGRFFFLPGLLMKTAFKWFSFVSFTSETKDGFYFGGSS